MTRVLIDRTGQAIAGFEISGHAGYAAHGEDIVCAAVSAISQTTVIGITEVLGLDATVEQDDEAGLLRLSLGGIESGEAQLLLRTMVAGLTNIQIQYPDFIRITFSKRR